MIHHYLQPIIDRVGILNCLSDPIKLGQSFCVEALKSSNRCFGNHETRIGDIKIITGMNEPGKRIHQDAMAGRWLQIDYDVPSPADEIVNPIIMTDDNSSVAGPASSRDERRAGRRRRLVNVRIFEPSL